jgi:hypothetical protein
MYRYKNSSGMIVIGDSKSPGLLIVSCMYESNMLDIKSNVQNELQAPRKYFKNIAHVVSNF